MSRHTAAVVIAITFGLPAAPEAAMTLGAFEGAGTVNGNALTVSSTSVPGGGEQAPKGVVTVNGRPFRVVCAEVRAVPSRTDGGETAPAEVAFWGRGIDADGKTILVSARDRGRADQAGYLTTERIGSPEAANCGANEILYTPIDFGDFVGIAANIPDLGLPLPAAGPAGQARILTYNVAFLYAKALYPSGAPSLPTCGTSCDPLELPPFPGPCACPEMTLWPNDHRFANLGEVERAEKIAERIVATDQDVVVLNELFHPGARAALVKALAANGPYKHYISLLRGHAPEEGLTLNDIVAEGVGEDSAFLKAFFENQSEFFDYEAVPNPSGVAIFSKFRFLRLQGSSIVDDGACPDPECQVVGQSDGAPIQPGLYAFDVYDDCSSVDCWASKGVGLVKIDTPGEPIYVAFTHMQADYPDEGKLFPGTRAEQFEAVRDLLVGAIPAAEIAGASIYVAGDLNVAGAPRTTDPTAETEEWRAIFAKSPNGNVADGFFACGNGAPSGGGTQPCQLGQNGPWELTDSWGFETSPTDRGISNETDGARLDYLLHSSGRRCMQHATIAWNLQADAYGNGGLAWLSDHLPLRADFGRSATWCSANDDAEAALPARNLHDFTFGPTNCIDGAGPNSPNPPCHQDEVVSPPEAQIGPPGAFQWFRIQQGGTYSFDLDPVLSNAEVDFAIYHHTDLSRPIAPFEEKEGELGIVYYLPEPPYYIRAFAVDVNGKPDRTAGNRPYVLKVHQHLCRSPFDACVIDPGLATDAPDPYAWPKTVDLLSELRELWWRFKTSGVAGGRLRAGSAAGIRFPTVRMQMESGSTGHECITQVAPVVERWNDHLFPTQLEETIPFVETQVDDDGDFEDDGLADDLRVAPDLPGKVDDQFQVYFVKITRNSNWQDGFNDCNQGFTSFLSYHTDLTYFVPRELRLYAELDDDLGEEDNLRLHMEWDGDGFQSYPPAAESVEIALEEPDSGWAPMELSGYAKLRGYYVDRVWPTMWEIDEEKLILPWAYAPAAPITSLSSWAVSAPKKGQSFLPSIQYSDDSNPNGLDGADYFYRYPYKVCHLETEPVCANP